MRLTIGSPPRRASTTDRRALSIQANQGPLSDEGRNIGAMKTFLKLLLAAAAVFGAAKLVQGQRQLPAPSDDIWTPVEADADAT